jgi:hypothetical protein
MQQIINVITPATSQDLTTLDEVKAMMRIPPTDTASDALLTQLITDVSETVARMCNRIFGYEEVEETYFQLSDDASQRLYLTRWPVALADISLFESDGTNFLGVPDEWVLEEATGTLYRRPDLGPWGGTINVVYSGGYNLPDDAPGPLKFAAQAVIREGYMAWVRNPALYGVRQTRHKESSQTYYPPNLVSMSTLGTSETWRGVQGILNKYVRLWV